MTETNNVQVDDTQDIDIVMPMYNLIEYSNIYSTISRIFGSAIEMNQL